MSYFIDSQNTQVSGNLMVEISIPPNFFSVASSTPTLLGSKLFAIVIYPLSSAIFFRLLLFFLILFFGIKLTFKYSPPFLFNSVWKLTLQDFWDLPSFTSKILSAPIILNLILTFHTVFVLLFRLILSKISLVLLVLDYF